MIDIHTHVLPGIDDGSDSEEETVEMLRVAHQSGTRTVVATPHLFHPNFSTTVLGEVRSLFERLTEYLEKEAETEGLEFLAEMDLMLGGENFWGSAFVESMAAGQVMTLNQSSHALVEFVPISSRGQLLQATKVMISEGLVPVLAHVERYDVVVREPHVLEEFLGRGCLTQLNAGSLDGRPWNSRKRLALRLLDKGLISLIATDAHGLSRRTPSMHTALRTLGRRYSAEEVRGWTLDLPGRIIQWK